MQPPFFSSSLIRILSTGAAVSLQRRELPLNCQFARIQELTLCLLKHTFTLSAPVLASFNSHATPYRTPIPTPTHFICPPLSSTTNSFSSFLLLRSSLLFRPPPSSRTTLILCHPFRHSPVLMIVCIFDTSNNIRSPFYPPKKV